MSHSVINQLIHVMWSTDNQKFHIPEPIRNELYAYITKLIQTKSGNVFVCGGYNDHIHLLVSLPADISLSSFVGFVKVYTSKWIKHRDTIDPNFAWQKGYFAASLQEDRINAVCQYIKMNASHHFSKNINYRDELIDMLKKQNISFQEQYLMQNSFSKVNLHIVWSTYNRNPSLIKEIRTALYAQISKSFDNNQSKVLSIGGVDDHVHSLIEISKNMALSDLMREVKTSATHWLKNNDYERFQNFEWQTGFGAFSVSLSGIESVKCYIENQEERHKEKSYTEEWNEFFLNLGSPRFGP